MIITKKELRAKNISLTRAQISERAIEIAEMIINGSYKNAVACIGRMVSLSKTIEDGYWREKFQHGATMEGYYLKSNLNPEHPDKKTEVN